jgi:molybdopterin molybdotransferase
LGVGRSESDLHPNAQRPTPNAQHPLLPTAPTLDAVLTASVSSDPGKEDYIRVRLRWEPGDGPGAGRWLSEPVLGKSALIATMVEADGMLIIPEGVEGIEAGETVRVELF